jgi:hypothetical protein
MPCRSVTYRGRPGSALSFLTGRLQWADAHGRLDKCLFDWPKIEASVMNRDHEYE